MEGVGNCCWDMHAKKGHRGEKRELYSGDPFYPEFKPISIRKKNCPRRIADYDDYY